MDNYYYRIYYKSSTVSFHNIWHTLKEVNQFIEDREERLSGVTITIMQEYGWDEKEREELARLKEKYEPNPHPLKVAEEMETV